MSYFPEDIPFMSKEELRENGIRIPKDATDTNVGDKISKFIDGLEEIFADIRERHVDDSVCGLCEYDGAYIGESGDWCNECPGFEKDDCFKLSDKTRRKWTAEIIKALPTVQPEKTQLSQEGATFDTISRQAAIDIVVFECGKWTGLAKEISKQLKQLPPAQPEVLACGNGELVAKPEPQWIPVSERLPEDLEEVNVTWVNRNPEPYYESIKDKSFTATAVYYKGKWYWWSTYTQDLLAEYGERCSVGLLHEAIEVTAWMPLPSPYQKGATT